jgi:hypothetical protein
MTFDKTCTAGVRAPCGSATRSRIVGKTRESEPRARRGDGSRPSRGRLSRDPGRCAGRYARPAPVQVSYAARNATMSTGTASLKLDSDPLGSPDFIERFRRADRWRPSPKGPANTLAAHRCGGARPRACSARRIASRLAFGESLGAARRSSGASGFLTHSGSATNFLQRLSGIGV